MPPLDVGRDLEGGRIFTGLGKEREHTSYIRNATLTSQKEMGEGHTQCSTDITGKMAEGRPQCSTDVTQGHSPLQL
jgi:hypothetical protein